MNAFHSLDLSDFPISAFIFAVKAIHFHDSVAVIEKTQLLDQAGKVKLPRAVMAGEVEGERCEPATLWLNLR